MKKILDFRHIIIVILVGLILLMFLNPGGFMPNRTTIVAQIDSIPYPVHDTVELETEVQVEVPVEYETQVIVRDTVTLPVDTAAILKDFYAKNEIKETLTLPNGLGTIALNETITQNKVLSRSFDAKVKQKVVKDTIYTPEPKKTQLFFGFDANFDKPNVVRLMGVGLLLKDKKDRIYKVSTGVNNTVENGLTGEFIPYVGGGVYWKINLNKKK